MKKINCEVVVLLYEDVITTFFPKKKKIDKVMAISHNSQIWPDQLVLTLVCVHCLIHRL